MLLNSSLSHLEIEEKLYLKEIKNQIENQKYQKYQQK